MRYALLSDIHANVQALDAVLADIDSRPDIDAVYHLGDLVGYSSDPNDVVDRLEARRIKGVAGNYDSTVATGYKHCGCRSENPEQEALAHVSFAWTCANTSVQAKHVLAVLPFRIDLKPFGGHVAGPTVSLVHATPTSNLVYVTEDRSDGFLLKAAGSARLTSGDVICFGHTHKPWSRVVDGIRFVNTGSVGRPKDGDWRAGYAILDVTASGESRVEQVRVPYDIDGAVEGLRSAGLPEEFGEFLRNGGTTA